MPEDKKEVKPEGGTPGEPSAPTKPEVVPSPEVTTEPPKPKETEDVKNLPKFQEQITNLNIALKQERESRRTDSEEQSGKVKALEDERKVLLETIDTLKPLTDAMKPKEVEDETPAPGLTKEEMEEFFKKKEEERTVKDVETKRAELINSEIKELGEKYDGKDGKPVYNDQEILEWQKETGQLYLTPKQAFFLKNQDVLIDYETKQRLNGKKPTETAEQPTTTPESHEPDETPPAEIDTRKAIMEAMENVENEGE